MDYIKPFLGARTRINSTQWGQMTLESQSFTPASDGDLVCIIGEPLKQEAPLVRIHSECILSEVFHSDLCDCKEQLTIAMEQISKEGHGIIFYLRFPGRGAGLAAQIKATSLEIQGMNTYDSRVSIGVPPESRDFTPIGKYLSSQGYKKVRLMTNNPLKKAGVINEGIEIISIPLTVENYNENVKLLYKTKRDFFDHDISSDV
ncbi:hypothetical protein OQZ33_17215 [Pedobacter sp. MC2016-05]|uniref:hypothetical protein n=1 Tax=Pedobacter sp. MC2016-05 TaxID=2994474 RepID=UPI002247428D|nr:hypothetical protein [Pedobacter sp. MC2016-05]MCX2476077.1 hypothetical protein [Pedobacter sp. MC2016-05]